MNIATVGIDLAKNVFSVHGVDAHGKTVLKKTASRSKLLELFANLPPASSPRPSSSRIARAAKHARIVWAMLTRGEAYRITPAGQT